MRSTTERRLRRKNERLYKTTMEPVSYKTKRGRTRLSPRSRKRECVVHDHQKRFRIEETTLYDIK